MASHKTPIVVLTGGIGCGKSEAEKQFTALGVPVINTDAIAHALTATGSPLLGEINRLLDANFLTAEGALDRAKLRTHVFSETTARLKLEALLHPAIYQQVRQQLAENIATHHPLYQVISVPLLFEKPNSPYTNIADQILVIDCDEPLQITRAMSRSHLNEAQVKAIMATQVSRNTRLQSADVVIENNQSISAFLEKITQFHENFVKTCTVS